MTTENDSVESVDILEDYQRRIVPMIDHAMALGAARMAMIRREHQVKCEAEEAQYKPAGVFAAGDTVVLTGRALHAMGQRRGSDVARVWKVQDCACDLCQLGRHVATDQATAEGQRHIATTALRHEGQPTVDELPVGYTAQDTAAITRGLDLRDVTYPPRRPPSDVSTEQANAEARKAFERTMTILAGIIH